MELVCLPDIKGVIFARDVSLACVMARSSGILETWTRASSFDGVRYVDEDNVKQENIDDMKLEKRIMKVPLQILLLNSLLLKE